MSDPIIKVDGLYKKFCGSLKRSLGYGTLDMLRASAGFRVDPGLRQSEFWAIRGVSFDLRAGETLGILGLNGSGKSTLLRIITGIFPPDRGSITIRGKLGSLIALGAGFHPHMTGRENIFLNGTILGMGRGEIERKMGEIVAFSGLESFLDAPIASYSSGMIVRLGFSIAIHSDLDVMLVDEVISVGDLGFQNKCLRKIYEKKKEGVSFIFVSHNIDTVRLICDRGLLLDKGEVISKGSIEPVIMDYSRIVRGVKRQGLEREFRESSSDFKTDLRSIRLEIASERPEGNSINVGEDLNIFWTFVPLKEIDQLAVEVAIVDERSINVACIKTRMPGDVSRLISDRNYRLGLTLKSPNLLPGVYRVCCKILGSEFSVESPSHAFVVDGDAFTMNALGNLAASWKIDECIHE